MLESLLDEVSGLGEGRRRALITHFGSVTRLRKATETEIAEVPGIGPKTAAIIVAALAQPTPEGDLPAIDMSTGEILD